MVWGSLKYLRNPNKEYTLSIIWQKRVLSLLTCSVFRSVKRPAWVSSTAWRVRDHQHCQYPHWLRLHPQDPLSPNSSCQRWKGIKPTIYFHLFCWYWYCSSLSSLANAMIDNEQCSVGFSLFRPQLQFFWPSFEEYIAWRRGKMSSASEAGNFLLILGQTYPLWGMDSRFGTKRPELQKP